MVDGLPGGIEAVVFDFDGTLARTEIDFARMRERSEEVVRAWGLYDGELLAGRYVLEMVELAAGRLAGEAQARFRAEVMGAIEEVEMLTCPGSHPFPGVPEALERLRAAGYRIGIITRNCRRAVESVLDRYALAHEVLMTRDDTDRVKPDPAHLLLALEALGTPPEKALMVGDHRTDIECGLAAGAWTCGVLTDRTPREELLEVGAHLVVADVPELVRVLVGGGGR